MTKHSGADETDPEHQRKDRHERAKRETNRARFVP